jgi:hypothetical protein
MLFNREGGRYRGISLLFIKSRASGGNKSLRLRLGDGRRFRLPFLLRGGLSSFDGAVDGRSELSFLSLFFDTERLILPYTTGLLL